MQRRRLKVKRNPKNTAQELFSQAPIFSNAKHDQKEKFFLLDFFVLVILKVAQMGVIYKGVFEKILGTPGVPCRCALVTIKLRHLSVRRGRTCREVARKLTDYSTLPRTGGTVAQAERRRRFAHHHAFSQSQQKADALESPTTVGWGLKVAHQV